MAGVIKLLILRAASKVRRLKNKKAAHTVRPAPTPGQLTLALTFLIHFDDRIKRITRLRTAANEVCRPASPDKESLVCKDGPEGADTTFLKCTYTDFSRLISSCMRET